MTRDAAREAEAPIPMILFCPACGEQHVDEPDERTPGWTNPPHKSHLCHGCGHIWRPCDRPTEGVRAIKTRGKADSEPAEPAAILAEIAALRRALEPLARVALPEDFHPGAPGEPAEDGWCNIYTGGLTNGDIRRARKLIPTPSAGGAHG